MFETSKGSSKSSSSRGTSRGGKIKKSYSATSDSKKQPSTQPTYTRPAATTVDYSKKIKALEDESKKIKSLEDGRKKLLQKIESLHSALKGKDSVIITQEEEYKATMSALEEQKQTILKHMNTITALKFKIAKLKEGQEIPDIPISTYYTPIENISIPSRYIEKGVQELSQVSSEDITKIIGSLTAKQAQYALTLIQQEKSLIFALASTKFVK